MDWSASHPRCRSSLFLSGSPNVSQRSATRRCTYSELIHFIFFTAHLWFSRNLAETYFSKRLKMKLNTVLSVATISSSCCAASKEKCVSSHPILDPAVGRMPNQSSKLIQHSLEKRAGTCSVGIGRQFADVHWDVTVYNVPQPKPQDVNIIATLRNTKMDKGESLSVKWDSNTMNITNIDNAPVFTYNEPNLKGSFVDFGPGETKVELEFQVGSTKWTTDDCSASSVVFSAGREGWACDFPCP